MPVQLKSVSTPINRKDPIDVAKTTIDLTLSGSLLKTYLNLNKLLLRTISPSSALKAGDSLDVHDRLHLSLGGSFRSLAVWQRYLFRAALTACVFDA